MSEWNSRLNNIMNNLMDILISSVKMVGSYGRDLWDSVSPIWKDDHLSAPNNEDGIWNGGVTNSNKGNGVDYYDEEETTTTPYDDIIMYDGMMEDIED